MDLNILSIYYLYVVVAANFFRAFMYTFRVDDVTKVKLTPESWADLKIREVAYAWIGAIRVFSAFEPSLVS